MQRNEIPNPPVEGRVYGEIAALITIVGIVIALIGVAINLTKGGELLDTSKLIQGLLEGRSPHEIWKTDSVFKAEPHGYWFFGYLSTGEGLSMAGLAIACWGGVIGAWSIFLAMFRSKEVLLYKKGLYPVLAFVISVILTLAALGILSIRH
ncbi:DUF1634 domain-containing protein [Archaeoglobus neptunius]|uniref:DUF1634 domain-containing protein n=1 Tax=Archaeoglobus neptunius TaxID=2798580 RepID=UPI0019253DC8|nr:DUF1634 domain-containing protein [Archaeoglobus neptunius]